MTKAVPITPQIQAWLNAAAGSEVDPNTIVVFEAVAVNTKPLMKSGSIFENATISRSTLEDMAAAVNGGESVPLHTLHLQGYELPVGKLIQCTVVDAADGSSELRSLFFLSKETQAKLISDIQNGIIDEVSVGLRTKKALCSECGWDFFGEESSFVNLYDRVCANDHKIGVDGVHLNLVGMERFFELSLVSKGAARNAKILSRSKQALAASADFEKLAASGIPPETQIVIASVKDKESDMDVSVLVAEVASKSSALALAEKDAKEKGDALTAANAKITDLEAKIAELSAASPAKDEVAAKLTETEAKLKKVEEDLQLANEFLADEAKKALVASGKADAEVAKDASGLVAQIKDTKLALLNLIPAGGRSVAADAGAEETPRKSLGAFKTVNS
jgi:hypothetical protein